MEYLLLFNIAIYYYYFYIFLQENDVDSNPYLGAKLWGKSRLRLGLKQAVFGKVPEILLGAQAGPPFFQG